MLTFRKGTGSPDAAKAMAEYLAELPIEAVSLSDYYLKGVLRGDEAGAAAVPRVDMPPELVALLGFDMSRTAKIEEVTNLLAGLRVDGGTIAGKASTKLGEGRDRLTYFDFTFSAPKSVSVAMALAPTTAERHVIVGAHRDAVQSAMLNLEEIVAIARKGQGGTKGYVEGQLGWVTFDHYTARPAVEIPHIEADGTRSTLIESVNNPDVAADMQLHTHVLTPNVVAARDGSVGSMDTLALHDRVLEVGALYQAHLADNLRRAGVAVRLDMEKGAAMLPDVPVNITRAFSKRHHEGEDAARDYIRKQGLEWDALAAPDLVKLLRQGSSRTRRDKDNVAVRGSDFDRWKQEAARHGYEHASVIHDELKRREAKPREARLLEGYDIAQTLLDRQFQSKSVLKATVARTASAQALIAVGIDRAEDVGDITQLMRNHGVRHAGERVALIVGEVPGDDDKGFDDRRRRVKLTTTKHVDMEERAMALFVEGAKDKSASLRPDEIDRAIAAVEKRDNLDFSTDHGREQRRVIHALGAAGRVGATIGVAGAGKSTLIRPLVEAWTNPERGEPRQVIGTANAWRQSSPLADANIPPDKAMAVAKLQWMVKQGDITLDKNTVIIVDEMSQVGTVFALQLAEWQAKHGFTVVMLGDDKQGQAIDAGSSLGLLQRALGKEAMPELISSVRQLKERDRETALLFRAGKAEEAIDRLREDGHAVLVPGGRRHAINAVADLWEQRTAAGADRADFKLTVSAPTNDDARSISAVIRERRRATGGVGPDQMVASAIDQNKVQFDLPLAVGDRVRLFARTMARLQEGGGLNGYSVIGNNGSVLEVERITADGLQMKTDRGTSGFVKWGALADEKTGRVRLTYGDVISIDAVQSATSTEHINALVSGSQAANGFKGYVAQSRAREISWLVVPDGLERVEIQTKRAMGSTSPVTTGDVWANVGENLSRQPEKELGVKLIEEATRVYRGSLRDLATAFQPAQQARAEGRQAANGFQERRDERQVAAAAPALAQGATATAATTARTAKKLAEPDMRQAVREAKRAAAKPKNRRESVVPVQPVSEADARRQFRDALSDAGLVIKGDPMMDGKPHYTSVRDTKGKRGFYIGHLDGSGVPAGTIINHKTGLRVDWRANVETRPMTAAESAAYRDKVQAEKEARDVGQRRTEAAAAQKAQAIWRQVERRQSGAVPVDAHPYLQRKGISSHGLRANKRGQLIVPMQDVAGTIWGVQTITADGTKLYMAGARKKGMHAVLGSLAGTGPIVIAEGVATAATMRQATGFATVVAFDSGNLPHVAAALRKAHPDRTIIIAADNDHHLPRQNPALPNVGIEKAQAAATEIGALVMIPAFPDTATKARTDWNDVAADPKRGIKEVRQAAADALAPLGIPLSEWSAPVVNQAAREAAWSSSSPAVYVRRPGVEPERPTVRPNAPSL